MPSDEHYKLLRTDDNGNRFVLATGLTQDQAQAMLEDFTLRGHKQYYEMIAEEEWSMNSSIS